MAQLEKEGTLHPDARALFQESMKNENNCADVVAAIMTQLSMKAGFKEWDEEAEKAAKAETHQSRIRDSF